MGFLPPVNLLVYTPSGGRVSFRKRRWNKSCSLLPLYDGFDQSQEVVDCSIFGLNMNDEP